VAVCQWLDELGDGDGAGQYRFRDRRQAVDTSAPFDEDLATLVDEWAHEGGAQAIDAYLERLETLRRVLLDAPEGAGAPDLLSLLRDAH
jgi:hypothetical protein